MENGKQIIMQKKERAIKGVCDERCQGTFKAVKDSALLQSSGKASVKKQANLFLEGWVE